MSAMPKTPEAGEPIDRAHLQHMVLGDAALATELLTLFMRQADQMLQRIAQEPAQRGRAAHVINGSARGIGAWRVAEVAAHMEEAADTEAAALLARLQDAVAEARIAAEGMLRKAAA